MSDYISKKAIMNHIESEYRKWGEDYDAEQILGDIEDFPNAFDLEGVIDKLESKALEHTLNGQQYKKDKFDIFESKEVGIKQGIETAIEILKSATSNKNGGN